MENEKKKLGRPAKAKTEETIQARPKQARPNPSNRSKRPRRSSANQAGIGPMSLSGDLDTENYSYRIVNDEGNRIELLKSYGYEIDQNQDVSFTSGNAVKTGSSHSIVVDKRTGKKGVLMRQPIEFHEEDKKAKAALIDKTEESMFRKLKSEDGRYGEVENTNALAKSTED